MPSAVPLQARRADAGDGDDPEGEGEAQWSTKDIYWRGQPAKIITQNRNGPCSLIALCNVLLLRGEVHLTPPDRPVVSYSYLSQLLADHLLARSASDPSLDLGAALSILPRTQRGLDVDVCFASHDAFSTTRPAADADAPSPSDQSDSGAGELALFKLCGVPLVHGWLADPADSQAYQAVLQAGSYNRAVDVVVQGDEIAKGAVVQDRGVGALASQLEAASLSKAPAAAHGDGATADPSSWSEHEAAQVHQALVVQQFLDSTSTQLTYHGLFVLAQAIQPGQLVALFRNSHVSVLYCRLPDEGGADSDATPNLFTLVTDSAFLMEDEIVWESLVDVDGASSEFFDGKLRKATVRGGGDFVGGRQEGGLVDGSGGPTSQQIEDADYALAVQLHQRDQDRLEDARRRRQFRNGAGGGVVPRPGMGQRPQGNAPGSSYDGHRMGAHNGYDPGYAAAAAAASAPIVPTEVFTTMRYQGPISRADADALVDAMLPDELVRRKKIGAAAPATATATAMAGPSAPSTNPFLAEGEIVQQPVVAVPVPPTNPFAPAMAAAAAEEAAPLDPVVASHRLARHVPLLSAHLERLEVSAGAMCRIYPQAWSATLLKQRRVLEKQEILRAIDEAVSSAPPGGSEVRGIRVAIKRGGRIEVHLRDLTPFPSSSSLSGDADGGLAGRAPAPSVRIDTEPTRVRMLDLEPVVFNKTDARGFYEAAKVRASADPSVLSGVRPEDGRCFDVILWTDEALEGVQGGTPADAGASASGAEAQVTESSIANVVVELLPPGSGAGAPSRFVTPPTQLGMLDGLLRRRLVDEGLIDEEAVAVSRLRALVARGEARVWLCNSLRGVWQVELVDNLAFTLPPAGSQGQAAMAPRRRDENGGEAKKRFSSLMRKKSSSAAAAAAGTAAATSHRRDPSGNGGTGAGAGAGAGSGAGSAETDLTGGKKKKGAKGKDDKCVVM
ncbi:uncharacterized protein PSFLO_06034 [Pseudozyma flocculosa]|uniref:MINDY deubiquitinase domain-containing protein n=1 Tax=Pseudozyma flocculosa TaxID=84751 RepID=A0A5C3F861_9BASI|nr:uncharacterized protein PSFLO_06034 [Pseudozyma flocculosa]